jgi:hypothetical protein
MFTQWGYGLVFTNGGTGTGFNLSRRCPGPQEWRLLTLKPFPSDYPGAILPAPLSAGISLFRDIELPHLQPEIP